MVGEVGYFLPLTGLLAPNEDFAIIRRRSDDIAIFRVGLKIRIGSWSVMLSGANVVAMGMADP